MLSNPKILVTHETRHVKVCEGGGRAGTGRANQALSTAIEVLNAGRGESVRRDPQHTVLYFQNFQVRRSSRLLPCDVQQRQASENFPRQVKHVEERFPVGIKFHQAKSKNQDPSVVGGYQGNVTRKLRRVQLTNGLSRLAAGA